LLVLRLLLCVPGFPLMAPPLSFAVFSLLLRVPAGLRHHCCVLSPCSFTAYPHGCGGVWFVFDPAPQVLTFGSFDISVSPFITFYRLPPPLTAAKCSSPYPALHVPPFPNSAINCFSGVGCVWVHGPPTLLKKGFSPGTPNASLLSFLEGVDLGCVW